MHHSNNFFINSQATHEKKGLIKKIEKDHSRGGRVKKLEQLKDA